METMVILGSKKPKPVEVTKKIRNPTVEEFTF